VAGPSWTVHRADNITHHITHHITDHIILSIILYADLAQQRYRLPDGGGPDAGVP